MCFGWINACANKGYGNWKEYKSRVNQKQLFTISPAMSTYHRSAQRDLGLAQGNGKQRLTLLHPQPAEVIDSAMWPGAAMARMPGALRFLVWDVPVHPPTRDLDCLGLVQTRLLRSPSFFKNSVHCPLL